MPFVSQIGTASEIQVFLWKMLILDTFGVRIVEEQ